MSIVCDIADWESQPRHLRGVNWANPDATGLVVLLVGNSMWPINLVTMRPLTESANFTLKKFITPWERASALSANPSEAATATLTFPTSGLSTRSFSVAGRLRTRAAAGAGVGMRAGTNNIILWRNSGWDMRIGGTNYTAAGTYNLGQVYDYAISSSDAAAKLYVDGALTINGAVATAGSLSDTVAFLDSSGGGSHDLDLFWFGVWNRPIYAETVLRVKTNPWALIAP